MSRPAEYDARVRAWAAALRAGETATWAEFRSTATDVSVATDGPLPGSAQLEIVRRLGLLPVRPPRFEHLTDLVLSTTSPGRGMVDAPLPWPVDEAVFGTPAVEPELLPAQELVRAACAVLVRQLADLPGTSVPVESGSWWRRRGFVVLGAPATAALVRRRLLAAGWREGGWRPTYLVLGGALEDLMAESWAARIRSGGAVRWSRTWRAAASGDRLPPAIRLSEIAARLAAEHGADRVHVVLGRDPGAVLAAVGAALRTELAPVPTPSVDVAGTDLLRRLNPLLALVLGADRVPHVVGGPWSAARSAVQIEDRYPAGLAVPAPVREWARTCAARMAADLRAAQQAGDYAVHGDPEVLVTSTGPATTARRSAVDPVDVLELALGLIAELWQQETGRTV